MHLSNIYVSCKHNSLITFQASSVAWGSIWEGVTELLIFSLEINKYIPLTAPKTLGALWKLKAGWLIAATEHLAYTGFNASSSWRCISAHKCLYAFIYKNPQCKHSDPDMWSRWRTAAACLSSEDLVTVLTLTGGNFTFNLLVLLNFITADLFCSVFWTQMGEQAASYLSQLCKQYLQSLLACCPQGGCLCPLNLIISF